MSAAGLRGRAGTPLRRALEETGPIGSTTRQLSDRLGAPEPELARRLESLEASGDVVRLGRGLWVLPAYRELTASDEFVGPAEYVERFVQEGGPSLGKYRGPITFSANTNQPIHRWWPYVQGYSSEFVASVVEQSGLARGSRIHDPFAGSGTTLVEARRAGMAASGWEVLEPAALAARVKTRFDLDAGALRRAARSMLRRAERRRAGPPPFLRETRHQFPPSTLGELTRLGAVLPPDGRPVDEALRVAFGATLIPVSYLRRSPCLGYRPRRSGPTRSAFVEFSARAEAIATDLEQLDGGRRSWGPPVGVVRGDARQLTLPEGSVDLVVTSPPYVNGMDYVMNYKLDLAWLGYASSYAELAALRQASVACDNLPRAEAGRYTHRQDLPDPWLREILSRISENVARKGSYRRDDADGIVLRYFLDLVPVLRSVARGLRPGGRAVVVVGDSLLAGTYVPGDLLLARLGRAEGLRVAGVDVARTRRSGQRRSFSLRESVVTLERPAS